jgi:hypothetical protein
MAGGGDLEEAIALVVERFRGMRDKGGEPYVLHLFRVMLAVSSPAERMVAVLHDLVEDTATTLVELEQRGFPPEVIAAVSALTHPADWSYGDYIVELSRNPIARACKLADLRDNYGIDRVAYREGYELEDSRRLQRYILSYRFLAEQLDEASYRQRMKGLE